MNKTKIMKIETIQQILLNVYIIVFISSIFFLADSIKYKPVTYIEREKWEKCKHSTSQKEMEQFCR